MQVLLDDNLGRLALRRLRPWHRMLARVLAGRLDRQLADGARPEANAMLAARAIFLTSTAYRRALAASLRRMVATSARARPRLVSARSSAGIAFQPHIPPGRPQIRAATAELAGLAGSLTGPGPLPARGVAMVSLLLSDGGGPLYRAGRPGDLSTIVARAAQTLAS